MIGKLITAYGEAAFVMCDAKCDKAWGSTSRPRELCSEDEDDFVLLADGELGEAPANPDSYEGGVGKPRRPEDRLNRWCFRECERAEWAGHLDKDKLVQLKDWSQRQYNIPREVKAARDAAQSFNLGGPA